MKIIRLSSDRVDAVLAHIERHGRRCVIDDVTIELAVFPAAGPVAIVNGMTPGVQSFLARLGRADADDPAGGPDQPAAREPGAGGDAAPSDSGGEGNSDENKFGPPAGQPSGNADGDQPGARLADAASCNGEKGVGDEPSPGAAEPGSRGSARDRNAAGDVPGDNCGHDAAAGGDVPRESADAGAEGTVGHAGKPGGELASVGVALPSDRVGDAATESEASPHENAGAPEAPATGGGIGRFSARPVRSHGGVFADLRRLSKVAHADLRRAQAALTRLLMHGGASDASPRWRMSRIAIKTGAYLRAWSVTDRREEVGTPAMLVLSDVSGSMSNICRQITYIAATMRAAMRGTAEIAVATHSNGFMRQVMAGGASSPTSAALGCDPRVYAALVARYDVRAVVAVGDNDAEYLYAALADMLAVPVVWLDVYACNFGSPQPSRRALSSETAITPAGARRLIHIDRVSPETLYDALEMGVNMAIRAGG